MLLFLYGQETYLAKAKLQEIKARYQSLHEKTCNLLDIDCTNPSADSLEIELQTLPLFQEKRLLIVRNPLRNLRLADFLWTKREFLKTCSDVFLFFQEGELKTKHPLVQWLRRNGKAQRFSFLKGKRLDAWISKEFQALGISVESAALHELKRRTGNDLWRLRQEIRKLSAFQKTVDGSVRVSHVEALVADTFDTNVFWVIDRLAQKQKKEALRAISWHLRRGESPFRLLSLFAFQFRNLLLLKDMEERRLPREEIRSESSFHPFVLKKSMEAGSYFSLQELRRISRNLFEIDLAIKTGRLEPSLAPFLFAATL